MALSKYSHSSRAAVGGPKSLSSTRSDVNIMLNGEAALQAMTNDLRASILAAVEKKIYEVVPEAVKNLPARAIFF